MANLLDNYDQDTVSRKNYFDLLKTYAKSHHRQLQEASLRILWDRRQPTVARVSRLRVLAASRRRF